MHILFVCTGNTCRSPMAAALARTKLAEHGIEWQVSSAGVHAWPGMQMNALAKDALIRRHVPFLHHASQSVQRDLLDAVDIVFAMTTEHKNELLRQFPHIEKKVHELGAFTEDVSVNMAGSYDIVDPFGGSETEYEVCAADLENKIEKMIVLLQGDHQQYLEG